MATIAGSWPETGAEGGYSWQRLPADAVTNPGVLREFVESLGSCWDEGVPMAQTS